MTPYAKDYGPQFQQPTPRGFDRHDLRSSILSSNLPSPSLRHEIFDSSLESPYPSHNSLTVSHQCLDKQSDTWAGRKQEKMPNWNEFYKNGLPREIIVIEDTPEPSQHAPNAPTSGYHLIQAPVPQSSASKKRKIDHITTPQEPYERAKEEVRNHLPSAPTGKSGYLDTLLSGPQAQTRSSGEVAQPNSGQKRKRTRLQLEAEPSAILGTAAPAIGGYPGLSGPVIRSKDVAVRIGHTASTYSARKIDDDDGHYIVVPETNLTSQYQIKKLLGQGTFGKVVQAYDYRRNELVAVKVIRSVQKYRDAAKIELRVLQTLRQNDAENKYRCIHLRDCFDFYGHTCIVMDLLDSSLFDFLKGNSFVPFPNSHIQSFAKQLLTSVAFLHDLGLIHTDLKPENILLRDASYQTFTYNRVVPSSRTTPSRQAPQRRVLLSTDIRLIDFGSATFQDEYHSSVVSTRHYRAPEIILGLGWSFPCDIWSIGCILVEFFTGDALFQTHDNLEHLAMMETVLDSRVDMDLVRQVNKMANRGNGAASYFKRLKLCYPTAETTRGSRRFVRTLKKLDEIIPPTNGFMRSFLDLLQHMFVYDPARRITAKQALCHPWFQEQVCDDGTEAAKLAPGRAHLTQHHKRAQL
ncbi:hypothetical protein S7711_05695 [Stachybotrys chartarum IBT 7711]|uniref:Protein kinase domain-containing protein n=1 Tax=Stachybotrys chartarum (strain CBS 109288 / IBT 7711) TaxID=1280523 RepID=A0A084B1K5_STACB|nr:hypothetical protein S7711_05695 [Stachybotrys chartarum IBT 7711]